MQVGDELVTTLNKVTFENNSGKWNSVRAACLTVWKSDKVDRLVKQLEGYKKELTLRLLTLLNTKNDVHSSKLAERLDILDRNSKEIVEIVSINQSMLKRALDSHSQVVDDSEPCPAEDRHDETVAAILTSRDGTSRGITHTQPAAFRQAYHSFGNLIQTSTRFQEASTSNSLNRPVGKGELQIEDYSPVPRVILDCLFFRQITDRIEDVAQAHEDTFGWVYQDSTTTMAQKLWSRLIDWLEQGSGCYWVNGKAGSGKSTLMKHICRHALTQQALTVWAGENTLVTASFFFWNLGSTLQKSQEGLLRSLLHDILSKHQYLIPSIFPSLCRAVIVEKNISLIAPSFPELRKAFSYLANHVSSIKICLFIDGVDEYDGNHFQILDLISTLSSSKTVKLVVSSRPINPCIDAFSRWPSLRLQDLTYDDIRRYVEIELGGHPNMKKLVDREGPAASELLSEVSHKASGVFLWVKLVVISLTEGLQNHDRISDLRRRLDLLPADLEQLYRHMLGSMLPLYQQQASCFFQIVLRSTEVQQELPMTLRQLSYAEELDPIASSKSQHLALPMTQELARCEATERRVRSRCCGLIEVQDRTDDKQNFRIGFLHKTVAEFLRNDTVWAHIVSLTNNTLFECNISLLSSCICELKVSILSTEFGIDKRTLMLDYCLKYARLAEDTSMTPQTSLLGDLDNTMQLYFISANRDPSTWTRKMFDLSTFLALAIQSGLSLYVAEKIEEDHAIARSDDGNDYLYQALAIFLNGNGAIPMRHFAEIITCLLKRGADPNALSGWFSGTGGVPWQLLLNKAVSLTWAKTAFHAKAEAGDYGKLFADVLQQFIASGADISTHCTLPSGRRGSVSAVVQGLLTPSTVSRDRLHRRSAEDPAWSSKACKEICELIKEREAHCQAFFQATSRIGPNESGNSDEARSSTSGKQEGLLNASERVEDVRVLKSAKRSRSDFQSSEDNERIEDQPKKKYPIRGRTREHTHQNLVGLEDQSYQGETHLSLQELGSQEYPIFLE